jgi:cytoskeleton protein RodZ
MNEVAGQAPEPDVEAVGTQEVVSAGTLLRQAREAVGLHVASLAVALKVPVRKLEALEADRYDELLDAVFVRALASSVCRNLKIDPAPVLQRLPATGAPRLAHSQGGINAPFRSPRDVAAPGWKDQLSRPGILAVAALLLGALVLVLLPARREQQAAAPEPAPGEAAFQSAPADPVVGPDAPAPTGAAASAAAPVDATVAEPATPIPAAPPGAPAAGSVAATPAPAAPSVAAPAATSAAATTVAAPLPEGVVVFKAKGDSWVQVTDARGGVPLRRLLTAGESAAATGPLPLAVTVGSVSATEVRVRGRPFDLAPVSRDNVARFEVK